MIDGLLGGVKNFFAPDEEQLAQIDPRYGVPRADVRDAAINTLGNMSAILLAAGQPIAAEQRAKLLSGFGQAAGGFGTDLYNAAQRRLMQAQFDEKRTEMQELAQLREAQKANPQGLANSLGVPVEYIQRMSPSDLRTVMRQRATEDPQTRQLRGLQIQQAQQELGTKYVYQKLEDGTVVAINKTNPQDYKIIGGSGASRPLTPEERKAYNIPPDAPAVWDKGAPKLLQGGTTVNVGDKAGAQAANKIIEGAYGEVEAAKAAVSNMQLTNNIRGLLDEGVITGFGAEGKVLLGSAASAMGFGQNDQRLANTYAATAQLAQRTLSMAEKMKGALSDTDVKFLKSISGTIALPEGAIRMILDLSDKVDRIALQRGQAAAQNLRDIPAIKEAGLGRMLDVPNAQSYEKQITVDGQQMTARLGVDGKYYVMRNGKRFRVED